MCMWSPSCSLSRFHMYGTPAATDCQIRFSHPVLVTLADKIKENRFKILIMCYLSFAIISNTVTTGAFEVYFDDELVFSKIRKYRYPTTEVASPSVPHS